MEDNFKEVGQEEDIPEQVAHIVDHTEVVTIQIDLVIILRAAIYIDLVIIHKAAIQIDLVKQSHPLHTQADQQVEHFHIQADQRVEHFQIQVDQQEEHPQDPFLLDKQYHLPQMAFRNPDHYYCR